jgi:hypothetical protein
LPAADRGLPAADRALRPPAGQALHAGRSRPEPQLGVAPALRPALPGPELGRAESARAPEARFAEPSAGGRPELTANLSLADLERVRQALALLSDEPATGSSGGSSAASDDGPVPSSVAASLPAARPAEGGEDETDTAPLPVILPGATAVPRPEVLTAPRGPFEPARVEPPASTAGLAPENTAVPAPVDAAVPEPAEPADKLPQAASEKLDEIKDLLITAEAIGEANLDRHFDRVSQRQRELIREFFDKAMPGREPEA